MNKDHTRKIKILFFITSLASGGAERVMVDILNHINRERFSPVLVLLYPLFNLPLSENLPQDIQVVVVQRKSESFIAKLIQAVNFYVVVSKLKPDIILSMLTHCNIMAILTKIFVRTKIIISEHNTLGEIIKTPDGRKILGISTALMVRILYRFSDSIITVSQGVRENLLREFGIPSDKTKVIYNPIDLKTISELKTVKPEHLFFKEAVPVLISLGRLVPQKGFDILIRSFGRVLAEVNARLIIVGEGPERTSLEEEAGRLKISESISFAGFQENPFQFLAQADLYVLSSRFEGMPMALLEAMACGLPVIATDCRSGPREVLKDGEYGILVPTENEEKLASEIIRLIKDNQLRENISALGRKRVMEFSSERIVKTYEQEISSLC